MRANVTLDENAYSFASAYAAAKGMPLGAAISELLRRAEQLPESPITTTKRSGLKESPRGYLVIARTGNAVTPEMVKDAAEDSLV